jgi:arsenate reductase
MSMNKARVLFVCVHNSARSQMAEAWCNHLCGDFLEAESAGLEPGTLNPLVVRAMQEVGLDISHNQTRDVFDLVKAGRLYSYVITVCDQAAAERCPIFPGVTKRLNWSFADPARLSGPDQKQLMAVRCIRDAIRDAIVEWADTLRRNQ